jgi:hydroxymethylbilane synthase
VDLAVHSYKDLPTAPARGLVIAAVPAREDPRDVLVARDGRKLADLPAGAVVGTGSPRRAAQLRASRHDLAIRPIRGNVDTRIGLVGSGEVDAVVLARAGLARLGRLDEVSQVLDVDEMLPAPAQGALAVECARGTDLAAQLAELDDPASRAAVEAERAVLAALEAGCSAPVGAYAEATDSEIFLRATVVSTDGAVRVRMSTTGPVADPRGLGRSLAAMMLADGAAALLGERHQ